jgi:uncharacterized protein (DUF983 family)
MNLLHRWGRALWLGATCRCPKCGQGPLFETFLQVRKTCSHCGVTFQPYAGDSLGVYAVCYGLSVVPGILAAILAGVYFQVGPYGVLATFSGVAGGILFGLYRNMKGLWIALVYLMTGLRKVL